MKNLSLAIFLSLNGQGEKALLFYQEVFGGKLLFKISNKEFKERYDPNLKIPEGKEDYLSHSVLQIGQTQLQIADNPVYEGLSHHQGNMVSFSLLVSEVVTAKEIYGKAIQNNETKILQTPIENEFADFYAIVKDPFGMIIQITKEKQGDPTKKGGEK